MQYEPIKKVLGGFFSRSPLMRKILYFLLDLLLLRTWHVKRAIRLAGRQLPENASVLDAGSGFGQYTWRMSSWYSKWIIKGVDINSEEIKECNNFFTETGRSPQVKFETGDLVALDDKDSYNFIITVDVMEHILEDGKVFSNFYKALKKNGILVISTPSDQGGSDVHHEEESSFIDEHVRDGYGKEEITSRLQNAGFGKVNVKYTYGKAGSISWILSMKFPVKMLNISYGFFLLLPFYYIIIFPFCFLLNIIDLNTIHKSGTGLLVIAEKQ